MEKDHFHSTILLSASFSSIASNLGACIRVIRDAFVQALTKNVSQEDLARAKNAAINQVLTNLESKAVVAEDIGRQVLTYGHRYTYKTL